MASMESTERHLTPSGWITGTRVWDGGRDVRPAPRDRVLTVLWYESGTGFANAAGTDRVVWRCGDEDQIARLLLQFGPAERDL
jgi:hypothetical protein